MTDEIRRRSRADGGFDTAEHASPSNAALTAGIEATAVVTCFVVLGRPLGLWQLRVR
jgi:hypothetical protein